MMNLIKMEWYKLRTAKLFLVLSAVVFGFNMLIAMLAPIASRLMMPGMDIPAVKLSEVITNPFSLGLPLILIYISAVSYLYLDFSGGYIKNIAGQVHSRGSLILSNFVVLSIHNLILFAVCVLSCVLGNAVAGNLNVDDAVAGGVLTFVIKWLLSLAICSILMFFAVGIRNKIIAIILAVVFSTGSLSLLYLGINTAVANIFKTENFDLGNYLPDSLINSVSVTSNTLVVNAIVVSVIFITVFVMLTSITFKKKDVK